MKELGLIVKVTDEKEISSISKKMNILIAVGNLELYTPILTAMEKEGKFKAIIFHFGDEYYRRLSTKIYRYNCITKIYRNHYPFSEISAINELISLPLRTIKYIQAYNKFETIPRLAIHIYQQLKFTINRIFFIWSNQKHRIKISYIPLGLHDEFPKNSYEKLAPSSYSAISFIGSLHSPERKSCATSSDKSLSHGYKGWGLSSTSSLSPNEYATKLRSAQVTLCPSGHFCQECFRFFEAIEVGTLPLVPAWSIGEQGSYYKKHLNIPEIIIVNSFSEIKPSEIYAKIASAGGTDWIIKEIKSSINSRFNKIRNDLEEKYADYSNNIPTGQ